MRLIDADVFEEYLKGLHDKYTEEIEECKKEGRTSGASYLNTHKELLINIMLRLKQQPTVNEWIPCSERLPERERGELPKPYLVCTNRGGCAIARYDGRWRVSGSVKVIAYMPLPEPYKGEQQCE